MAGEKKKGIGGKLLKLFLVLFLLLVLIVGGFALGVYLRLFDTNEANEQLGLYKLPVVGEYFVKPEPPSQEEMDNKPVTDAKPNPDKDKDKNKDKDKGSDKQVKISKKEIEEQMKEREKTERKRVSKLARLYNEMKPQDAVEAMEPLNDDLTVTILQRMDEGSAAKVLAEFEPEKAARLTQLMYEGNHRNMQTAADVERQLQQEAQQRENAASGQQGGQSGAGNAAAQP